LSERILPRGDGHEQLFIAVGGFFVGYGVGVWIFFIEPWKFSKKNILILFSGWMD